MAIVRPFAAIRPAEGKAEKVLALPYDVMNRQEAAAMAEGNPESFLHISRSEIDLPEEDAYSENVYKKAAENIKAFLADGVLIEEQKPCLYIYRQIMNERVQTGIVGCVSIDEYADGTISRHELTRVEKEMDRIHHFDACNMNTEPVFLTYRDEEKVESLVESWTDHHGPCYDIVDQSGVSHTLWVIDDDSIVEALAEAFSHVPRLYIADGHHRSASAYKVGKMRREQALDCAGNEEFNYFMAVIFPAGDLSIMDYNRVLADLAGNTPEELFEKIRNAGFTLTYKGETPYRPAACHEFSLYLDGKWYAMVLDASLVPKGEIESLDVSILQERVLAPVFGIDDPRTDERIDFVGGIRGLEELARRAESDMRLAIAVHPVSMETLMHIADCEKIMPPKSTWFEPKLGSGLFMHRL